MSMFSTPAPAPEKKDFELVPEGKHSGVIRFFIDCGHHHDSFKGEPIVKHEIFVGWELDCQDSEGNPHWKGDFYRASDYTDKKTHQDRIYFHDNSNFNKLLRAWTGEPADKVKWDSFIQNLIVKEYPATITVEHNQSKTDPTKTYSKIESVKPFKGKDTPHRQGEFVGWGFGDPGFEDLPSMVQRHINESIEKTEPGGYHRAPKGETLPSATDEDLPF